MSNHLFSSLLPAERDPEQTRMIALAAGISPTALENLRDLSRELAAS